MLPLSTSERHTFDGCLGDGCAKADFAADQTPDVGSRTSPATSALRSGGQHPSRTSSCSVASSVEIVGFVKHLAHCARCAARCCGTSPARRRMGHDGRAPTRSRLSAMLRPALPTHCDRNHAVVHSFHSSSELSSRTFPSWILSWLDTSRERWRVAHHLSAQLWTGRTQDTPPWQSSKAQVSVTPKRYASAVMLPAGCQLWGPQTLLALIPHTWCFLRQTALQMRSSSPAAEPRAATTWR
mmetsp:Transcript_33876/g.105697  ORF Transcript_33876/g.105697 Transcript_33876/m.105697 type:complete len:240 (+) Transcript_33876:239-958(+)